jgi:uncharacterized protein (DUF433 family)
MLDWNECPSVERSPDKVGGAWVFEGTSVPLTALFEALESNARIADFIELYPDVRREQVEAVLLHVENSLNVA